MGWERVEGGAMRIAVDGEGVLWIVTEEKEIFKRGVDKWEQVAGSAEDISIGADGSVFILGLAKVPGGSQILKFDHESKAWRKLNGGAKRLAVSSTGKPYIVTQGKRIYWPDDPCPEIYDKNDFLYRETAIEGTFSEAEMLC